ncbi:hypothetical protein SBY92_004821 [Candida maltosa Xu316]|uniref:Uncharacterized protein n=1 Tax=Candida maltosa (strain Xu316) TaxID=1245528 RepID=M3J1D9_CANMX|nr:hypothetical protein G210_4132 [Candida maltosa Xu316]
MSLDCLPIDTLNIIIDQTYQLNGTCSVTALCQTNKLFNYLINERLYQNIVIYDDDNQTITNQPHNQPQTFIHISKLNSFIECLTIGNFLHIRSFHIHCKSNFNKFNYDALYSKFNKFWSVVNHPIEFINFDVDNLRQKESLNQYLTQKNFTKIIQENDELQLADDDDSNSILRNLTNLTILKPGDKVHRNVSNLNIFLDGKYGEYVLNGNFENLKILQLNTTLSTESFMKSNITCPELERFAVTYSHFKNPSLKFNNITSKINFNKVQQLELRLNCHYSDCNCISEFYHDLACNVGEFNELQKLSIINHNSKNPFKYSNLVKYQLASIISQFHKLKYLYLSLNEYANNAIDINLATFSQLFRHSNLESLVIHDFFNYWLPSINSHQALSHRLLNNCKCAECVQSRKLFMSMADYDAENHYIHNFDHYQIPQDLNTQMEDQVILSKKSNSKFLSFIVNQLKMKQFKQSVVYSMNLNYFRKDNDLLPMFQKLFAHNCLSSLTNELKCANDNFRVINFGGVEMKC